jgi:hypothetical protein
MVSNVRWIRQAKFNSRIQKDITDPLNDRSLLSLADIKNFQQAAIALSQVQDISKHIIYEFLKLIVRNDRRLSGT